MSQSLTEADLASTRARVPRSLAWSLAVELVRRWQIRAVVPPGPGWRGLLILDDDRIVGRVTSHGDVEGANVVVLEVVARSCSRITLK